MTYPPSGSFASWKSEHIPTAPFSRIFYSLIHHSASMTFPLVFIDNWSSFVVCSRHENRSACLQLRYRIYSIPLFTINYRFSTDYIYFLIFTSISCSRRAALCCVPSASRSMNRTRRDGTSRETCGRCVRTVRVRSVARRPSYGTRSGCSIHDKRRNAGDCLSSTSPVQSRTSHAQSGTTRSRHDHDHRRDGVIVRTGTVDRHRRPRIDRAFNFACTAEKWNPTFVLYIHFYQCRLSLVSV